MQHGKRFSPFLPASYPSYVVKIVLSSPPPRPPCSNKQNKAKPPSSLHDPRPRVRFLLVVTIVLADKFGSYFSDVVNK